MPPGSPFLMEVAQDGAAKPALVKITMPPDGAPGDSRDFGVPVDLVAGAEAAEGQLVAVVGTELTPTGQARPSLIPLCAFVSHAQGSSGVVATMPLVWRGRTKSPTTRAGPSLELALRLE